MADEPLERPRKSGRRRLVTGEQHGQQLVTKLGVVHPRPVLVLRRNHQRENVRAPDLVDRTDILSLMISAEHEDGTRMDDAELRDQLLTMLLAGHETTATGLAWAFERLVRHPDAMAAAVTAANAGDDTYLDAVIKETLRVRPVIPDVARYVT